MGWGGVTEITSIDRSTIKGKLSLKKGSFTPFGFLNLRYRNMFCCPSDGELYRGLAVAWGVSTLLLQLS